MQGKTWSLLAFFPSVFSKWCLWGFECSTCLANGFNQSKKYITLYYTSPIGLFSPFFAEKIWGNHLFLVTTTGRYVAVFFYLFPPPSSWPAKSTNFTSSSTPNASKSSHLWSSCCAPLTLPNLAEWIFQAQNHKPLKGCVKKSSSRVPGLVPSAVKEASLLAPWTGLFLGGFLSSRYIQFGIWSRRYTWS